MSTIRRLLVAGFLFLGTAAPAAAQNGAVGEPAPEFSATVLEAETPVTVAQQRGRAVLLNKWSTWCKPCVEEMPFLERLHQRYREQGFSVVGVSIDRPGADGNVRRVADDRGVTYPIWRDPQDAFTSTFRSTGVPESVLLDNDGVVVRRWPGALTEDDATIDAAIERAIASTGTYVTKARTEVAQTSTVSFGLIGALAAVAAGLLSFLSPCVLPLVPSYLALMAGVRGAGEAVSRRSTMAHAVAFVLGFSAVFIALGASATVVGDALRDHDQWLTRIGGGLLIAFGLVLFGLVPLAFLQRDVRLLDRARGLRRFGPVGSGVVGAAFGAGWTPCIGPVLAGILALAASSGETAAGVALLAASSLGLAIPFLAAAFAIDCFRRPTMGRRNWLPWVNRVSGGLLVGLGVLLLTGALTNMSFAFRGQPMFSRTTDGGQTWSTPVSMTGNQNVYAQDNQIAVLPDGTLVNVFAILFKGAGVQPPQANQVFMAVTCSTDGGRSWHKIEKIAPIRTALLTDPDNPNPTSLDETVRADDYLPDIAVDHSTGDIYVVWSDGLGTPVNNVVITKSTDGGRRWSAPKAIDQAPGPHAFNQTVQVAGDGTVAVLYYDFRNNTPAPGLPTDVWLTQSTDGGASWAEQHVTGPFDMKLAPNARGFFLGDYMGLEAIGDDLLAFFATTQGDSANVYSVRANR